MTMIARLWYALIGRKEMSPVVKTDLADLLEPYWDTDLYLAVNREHSKVVGVGKSGEAALQDARKHGYDNPVIMHAPSKRLGMQI
jgi:hypothetical protein